MSDQLPEVFSIQSLHIQTISRALITLSTRLIRDLDGGARSPPCVGLKCGGKGSRLGLPGSEAPNAEWIPYV